MGGMVPAGGLVVATAVPYTVPDVGHKDWKCPVCHQLLTKEAHGYPQRFQAPLFFLSQVPVILQDVGACITLLVSRGGNTFAPSATKSTPVFRS